MYMPEGVLARGETALLVYGFPGSRSGPFFYIACEGPAVTVSGDKEVLEDTLDEKGWLRPYWKLAATLTAAEPGAAVIRIDKKDHFLNAEKTGQEIKITVVPAP